MKTEYVVRSRSLWRPQHWLGAGLLILLLLTFYSAPGGSSRIDPAGRVTPASACNGSGGGCG